MGGGSPRPHPPHPGPVGSGPRPHVRKDDWSGVGERPSPEAPNPVKGRLPRAPSCRPHSAQSQLAEARAVGLVTGPHARTPRTHSQWVVGPGRTPEGTRGQGWESVCPRTPLHPGKGRPARAPSCRPYSAQIQLARARAVGLVAGHHARSPRTQRQWVSDPAARPKGRVVRGGRAPEPGRPKPRREAPLRAPSCRPHSMQSQLAIARAVGLRMGPHARSPRTHRQWVVGPRRTPEMTSGRGWESARPRTPHTQAKGAPPGHSHVAPTARKATSQERALWGW